MQAAANQASRPNQFRARSESTPARHAYIQTLLEDARRHDAVRHPYLRALAGGAVPNLRWALADFARQYSGYSSHFISYLGATLAQLDDAGHRESLLANLEEESGSYGPGELAELRELGIQPEWIVGVPHPTLFRRFCAALGVEPVAAVDEAPEVRRWRESFSRLLTSGSPAIAIGALGLGTENIVRDIYAQLAEALERVEDLDPRDTAFFPLPASIDDHHTQTLAEIAADLATTPIARHELRHGMLVALSLRTRFWDWMYLRALDPPHTPR